MKAHEWREQTRFFLFSLFAVLVPMYALWCGWTWQSQLVETLIPLRRSSSLFPLVPCAFTFIQHVITRWYCHAEPQTNLLSCTQLGIIHGRMWRRLKRKKMSEISEVCSYDSAQRNSSCWVNVAGQHLSCEAVWSQGGRKQPNIK